VLTLHHMPVFSFLVLRRRHLLDGGDDQTPSWVLIHTEGGQTEFAADSPVEQAGFELPVPLATVSL
jgi:hypothetical protein